MSPRGVFVWWLSSFIVSFVSQLVNLILESFDDVIIIFSYYINSILQICFSWISILLTNFPSYWFQIITFLSAPPLAIYLAVGEYFTITTWSVWPERVRVHYFYSRFHTLTVWSALPEQNSVSSGLKSTE
jgi:hypothetical protein